MDVYQLQVFCSVYSNKSFSLASNELNITQPAISMHIKRLEDELGVRLFDRIARKVIPTKEGDLLYVRAGEIIAKLSDIKHDIESSEREVKGIINIITNSAVGSYIFPCLAAEFKKTYKDVFFHLGFERLNRIHEMLLSGDLLLAIVDDRKDIADIECLHTIDDELILVAKPGLIGKSVITPLHMLKIPLIIREDGSEARKSMEKQHLMHKISLKALNVTAILGSTDSIKEAVKSGLGASVLSRFTVRDDIRSGHLEEIRIRGIRMRKELYVISHRRRTLPEHYRRFVDFIVQEIPLPSR